jgi:hypothetical protein
MRTSTPPLASLALAALLALASSVPATNHSVSSAACGFTRALRIIQSVESVREHVYDAALQFGASAQTC